MQMMERLDGTGLLPRFSASESMMFQTEPLLDPGMVGTLLAGIVKLGNDPNIRAVRARLSYS